MICLVLPFYLVNATCKSPQYSTTSNDNFDQIYIDEFKLTYFRSLLLKGYNNSPDIQSVINFDRSGFTESLITEEDLNLIDSMTSVDNMIMVKDSSDRIGNVAEGAEGKHILSYVLRKLESQWLDSLAKARVKISVLN